MPITKNIPRHLNFDDDRRVLKGTELSSALNYSISSIDEEGTNVGSNSFGSTFVPAVDISNQVSVDISVSRFGYVTIGKAVDEVNRKIYFALAHDTNAIDDIITELDADTNTYSIVLSDERLRFSPTSFMKMDVVINVGQEQDVLLYFTDNINNPRKINIGRAKAGDYENLSNDQFNYATSVCKAANVYPPLAFFDTDSLIRHNNFKKDVYQFATQLIYKDGEESAISPYSALAIPPHVSFANNEDDEFFINDFTNNVLVVKIDMDDDLYSLDREVSEVRLLGKIGNLGTFYIIDQFNPRENKSTMIFGQDGVQVYNSQDRTYRFYNDTLGRFIPQQEVNKLYDNVPLVAEGQAHIGNRLMYSNYKEGRPNVETQASINTVYQEIEDQFLIGPNYGLSSPLAVSDSPTKLDANLAGIVSQETGLTLSDTLAGGEQIIFNIKLPQSFTSIDEVEAPTGFQLSTDQTDQASTDFFWTIPDQFVSTQWLDLTPVDNIESITTNFTLNLASPQTLNNAFISFSSFINNKRKRIRYESGGQVVYSLGDFQPTGGFPIELFGYIEVEWLFTTVFDSGSGILEISSTPSKIVRIVTQVQQMAGNGFITYPITDIYNDDGPVELISDVDGFIISDQTWIHGSDLTIQSSVSVSGFKNGSVHRLGVVYYDEFNRSGFFNEIGSAYVGWTNDPDRRSGQGSLNTSVNSNPSPAALEVDLGYIPPSWAKTYQIVYPGASSLLDYVQYTAGGAFLKRKGELEFDPVETRGVDTESKRIYVSLETLNEYRSDKNTFREYSFTEGDKLRIFSRKATVDAFIVDDLYEIYPSASDGTIIEFDVAGVELLDRSSDNPIAFRKDAQFNDIGITSSTSILKEHTGRFVVLENPRVVSGTQGTDGNQLKFLGFDWYALANSDRFGDGDSYPYLDGSTVEDGSVHWYKNVIVEIYTPRPNLHDEFWYEIGERRDIVPAIFIPGAPGGVSAVVPANHGGPFLVTKGDAFYRPVPCKSPSFREIEGSSGFDWFWQSPPIFSPGYTAINRDEWSYESRFLESNTPSDVIFDKMWHRGRPHIKFENAKTFHRFNQVTFSDPNVEDSKYLSLSSFNPSLANYYSFEATYGAARYISSFGDELNSLLCVQHNKFSMTPVDRRIISDSGGQTISSLNTDVLSSTNYYSGNYGCGTHPESVLVYDGSVYFADPERKSILRFSNGQLVPISKQKVNSVFNKVFDVFTDRTGRIPTGYDPSSDTFYVSFSQIFLDLETSSLDLAPQQTSINKYTYLKFISSGITLSYDATDRRWVSFHSFVPEIYAHVDNSMYTCRFVRNVSELPVVANGQDFWLHRHSIESPRCAYYFSQHGFQFSTSGNQNSSLSKVFDAYSIEGDGSFIGASISTETNQDASGSKSGFLKKEGVWYVDSPRSVSNSTSNIKPIGVVQDIDGLNIMVSSISGVSIPKLAPLFFIGSQGVLMPVSDPPATVESVSEPGTIVSSLPPTLLSVGDRLFIQTDASVDGDAMRGQWCDATVTLPLAPSPVSIFAFNFLYTRSPYGHALSE